MTTLIRSASFDASKSLALVGHSIKRSHIQEVLAAMLGYRTYAALSVEEQQDILEFHLDDAEMLVLNQPAAEQRAREIGIDQGAVTALVQACVSAIRDTAPMRVHNGLDDFYDDYARDALIDAITNSDNVAAAMAETNAYFDSEAELPYEAPATMDLWEARTEWSIETHGAIKGGHDVDSDRMFAGDTLNCRARLTFDKAGRAGLILFESDASAGVDESWREVDDEDYDDEGEPADLSDFGRQEF